MTVYIVATLLSCLLAWYAERNAEKPWLRILAALPLAAVAAARWGVGTDIYFLYIRQFSAVEWFRGGGGEELARQLFEPLFGIGTYSPVNGAPLGHAMGGWAAFNKEELGYRLLVEAIVWCGGSFRWFIAISSLATMALIFAVIWRQSRMPALAVYFFVTTSNYFLAMNIVRQYFAIALVLLAASYAVDRKAWRFLACIAIAMLFHKSAVVALPLWFLPRLRISPYWGFALVAVGFGASFAAAPVLRLALPKLGLGRYLWYLKSAYAADGFEAVFFALNLAFMTMGCWYYRGASDGNRRFTMWYWMTVLGTVALAFSGTVPLMKRINYYFAAPQFLMLPEMLCAESNPKLRRWLTVLAILAFAAETFVAVYMLNKNECLPYRILP